MKNNCRDKNSDTQNENLLRRTGHSASFRGFCSIPKCGRGKFNCFAPFPMAEGINSVDLHRSQMRKITKQQDCHFPKCGRQQNNRIIPFPTAEGINSTVLYRSQNAKAGNRQDCTFRARRREQNNIIVPFAKCEGSKTIRLYHSREAKASAQPNCTIREPRKPSDNQNEMIPWENQWYPLLPALFVYLRCHGRSTKSVLNRGTNSRYCKLSWYKVIRRI